MIIGKKIIRHEIIDSTNEEARRLICQGEGEGLVVLAGQQTKGRGRPGSCWFSPPGNLYFSAVVNPRKNSQALTLLTLMAALAARRAIKEIAALAVVIKWPNDLLIKGKKVGGILVERLASGHLIIGLGLNLNGRSFPPEIKNRATSLKLETQKTFSLDEFVNLLIAELNAGYLDYLLKIC